VSKENVFSARCSQFLELKTLKILNFALINPENSKNYFIEKKISKIFDYIFFELEFCGSEKSMKNLFRGENFFEKFLCKKNLEILKTE